MGGFEFNKFMTSVLLSILVILVINNSVNAAFDEEESHEQKKAFIVEVASSSTAAKQNDVAKAVKASVNFDVAALMSKANADSGRSLSKKCAICHTFNKGEPNKIGPNLWNIVNSKKAHLGDKFSYSKAMLSMGGEWNYKDLFTFIHKPSKFVKGTRMVFVGISKSSDIANLVAFLRSNSDAPATLPTKD